jgi:uncharacterized protein (TIGR02246 family)
MIFTSSTVRLFGVVCSAITLASTPAFAQQRGGSAAAEAAIAKTRAAYQAAALAQDAAAIAKLFTPDGIEMPPNAPLQKGRAAIEAYHKNLASQVMVHGVTIKPTETHVLGDVAYEVGTYTQNLMPMKGGKTTDDKGKYVVLLKKDASGAWLLTHSIYNSDLPLPAPAAAK